MNVISVTSLAHQLPELSLTWPIVFIGKIIKIGIDIDQDSTNVDLLCFLFFLFFFENWYINY